MFTIEQAPDTERCAIKGDLTVYTVRELRDRLVAAGAAGTMELDLSGINECDSAGLQLLLALGARVASASEAVRELAALYGIEERLAAGGGR